MAVLVVGSVNLDYTFYTDSFLKPGETIVGNTFKTFHGGKGANQAIAASRLNDKVAFIGAIGSESDNTSVIENFNQHNVECKKLYKKPGATGSAFINVVAGENAIAVIPGANELLTVNDIDVVEECIKKFDTVVVQLEIPGEVVERVLEIATKSRATVILDPAPSTNCTQKMLDLATFIKPNEHEYEDLKSRFRIEEEKCIVTYGEQGIEFYHDGEKQKIASKSVEVVDTTGAGDVFNGVFAAMYDKTHNIKKSLDYAIKYSAIAVTKNGAQIDFLED